MAPAPLKVLYQWETFANFMADAGSHIKRHWKELQGDEPFEPDWDRLFAFGREGRLKVFTARRGGVLLGYSIVIISPELLCVHRMQANSVAFWLDPVERTGWIGYHLFKKAEQGLEAMGVNEVCIQHKVDFCNDRGQTVAVILKRLGYRPTEVRSSKTLGEPRGIRIG